MLFIVLNRDFSLCGNLELIYQFKSKSHCKVYFVALLKSVTYVPEMFFFVARYNRSYMCMDVCVYMMLFQLT